MVSTQYLSVHCHYYQPQRGNPFAQQTLLEPDAAPYENWNARITAECYQPNADLGNFGLISFNIGETLATWLEEVSPGTYQAVLAADAQHVTNNRHGNAIAQPMHHTILPLSIRSDQVTQVTWGKKAFEHRFGRVPTGIWLPEMAVDLQTLEVLVDCGIKWTILTESQVDGKPAGAGPFWLLLPKGKKIKVFVRDEQLSNDMAFNLGRFGGAGRWAREVLIPRKRDAGALTLIATDGETFGHHWPGEEQFLHWLLEYEARSAGYSVVRLGEYVESVEPDSEVTLRENTAWSCGHGLARWATGCQCTGGNAYWKGAIRRAMDNLRFSLDDIYQREMSRRGILNALELRDGYIDVILGKIAEEKFLAGRDIRLNSEEAQGVLKLVEAQYYRQCMYASCTYFFAELDALTTRYGVANAAYAVQLTLKATGIDLSQDFRKDLSIATGQRIADGAPITGDQIYDEIVSSFSN